MMMSTHRFRFRILIDDVYVIIIQYIYTVHSVHQYSIYIY